MTCVVYNGDEDVEDLRVSHIVDSRLPWYLFLPLYRLSSATTERTGVSIYISKNSRELDIVDSV